MPNFETLTLSIVDYFALDLTSNYFSFTENNIWRCPEVVRLRTLKLVTEVDWWLFVIELVIFLKVSGIVPITDSQICHISVDCWILVIELVIFLKESGVGPITNSQICNIDVDCWILVMELVKSLKMSEVGPITNSQICHI